MNPNSSKGSSKEGSPQRSNKQTPIGVLLAPNGSPKLRKTAGFLSAREKLHPSEKSPKNQLLNELKKFKQKCLKKIQNEKKHGQKITRELNPNRRFGSTNFRASRVKHSSIFKQEVTTSRAGLIRRSLDHHVRLERQKINRYQRKPRDRFGYGGGQKFLQKVQNFNNKREKENEAKNQEVGGMGHREVSPIRKVKALRRDAEFEPNHLLDNCYFKRFRNTSNNDQKRQIEE